MSRLGNVGNKVNKMNDSHTMSVALYAMKKNKGRRWTAIRVFRGGLF